MDSRLNRFLEELSVLTKKYGIKISGCGCCGSPYLVDLNEGIIINTDLCYDDFGEVYTVDV